MNSLGIRVKKTEIFLSIYDNKNKEILQEKIKLPKIVDFPTKLKYLRFTLIDILNEYDIKFVGIKIAEQLAQKYQKCDTERVSIEGVIQESLATSDIKEYYIANIQSLSSILKIKPIYFKNLIDSADEFNKFTKIYINNFNEKTNEQKREAILIAIATNIKGEINGNRK